MKYETLGQTTKRPSRKVKEPPGRTPTRHETPPGTPSLDGLCLPQFHVRHADHGLLPFERTAKRIQAHLQELLVVLDLPSVLDHRIEPRLEPVGASLRYIAHEASQRPDGSYAYRVRATLDALKQSTTPAEVAAKRGLTVEQIFN